MYFGLDSDEPDIQFNSIDNTYHAQKEHGLASIVEDGPPEIHVFRASNIWIY